MQPAAPLEPAGADGERVETAVHVLVYSFLPGQNSLCGHLAKIRYINNLIFCILNLPNPKILKKIILNPKKFSGRVC